MEQFGGRKFLFCLLLTVLSFVLVLTKSITSKEWTDFIMVIGGLYILGNVGAKIADGIEKK